MLYLKAFIDRDVIDLLEGMLNDIVHWEENFHLRNGYVNGHFRGDAIGMMMMDQVLYLLNFKVYNILV